jgi:hypothetical protein
VRDAVAKGATVRVGGHRRDSGDGDFFEPTVLTGVDHSMTCMTEETFGPTLPIMRVESEDEAVRLANDSPFGLDSSVFAGDHRRGEHVARRLQAGSSVVNDTLVNYFAMEIPIGGAKESGIGARHGRVGIQKYCQRPEPRRHPLRPEPRALLLPVLEAVEPVDRPHDPCAVRAGRLGEEAGDGPQPSRGTTRAVHFADDQPPPAAALPHAAEGEAPEGVGLWVPLRTSPMPHGSSVLISP